MYRPFMSSSVGSFSPATPIAATGATNTKAPASRGPWSSRACGLHSREEAHHPSGTRKPHTLSISHSTTEMNPASPRRGAQTGGRPGRTGADDARTGTCTQTRPTAGHQHKSQWTRRVKIERVAHEQRFRCPRPCRGRGYLCSAESSRLRVVGVDRLWPCRRNREDACYDRSAVAESDRLGGATS
jgi:hypothetical protein